MITFDQALDCMLAAARPLAQECVPLAEALGRVLAEDVLSDVDMPPFAKSAMDGFACRRADLPGPFTVVEEIPAGRLPQKTIGAGEAARIMTGAPVPEGADCVLMIEETVSEADGRVRFAGARTADNICAQAEDVRRGEVVLARGSLLGPAHLAVLAAVGKTEVAVARRPRLSIIATGSELVAPEVVPSGALIRNSNSPQLLAQAQLAGAVATYYGIVADDPQATRDAIARARDENDVVVLSGGVSAGDFDYVPAALADCGYRILFDSVAMQPGRPTVFGERVDGQGWCVGLPGNPVSTYVIFELMLRPFLARLMGHALQPRWVEAELGEDIRRRNTKRQAALPVRFHGNATVRQIEYHGSGHIAAMTVAEGLVFLPVGCGELRQGSRVPVRLL